MVFHSKLEEAEVKKEKGVIIEEKRMYEDNPRSHVESLFEKALFGRTSLGRDIIGTEKSLKNMTREDLWNYYKGSYDVRNSIIGVAGNFKSDINKRIEKYLNLPEKSGVEKWFNVKNFEKQPAYKKLPLAKRVIVQTKKTDQVNVLLGFPGINYYDSRRFVADILLNILGGGMSSRLFTEIREKRGLAYGIRAEAEGYRDTGSIYIRTGLDPKRLDEALKTILAELKKIKKYPVSDMELKNAKSDLIGTLALSLENSRVVAMKGMHDTMVGIPVETYEYVSKKINAVTVKQIQKLAQDIFDERQLRLAVIGPVIAKQIIKIIK